MRISRLWLGAPGNQIRGAGQGIVQGRETGQPAVDAGDIGAVVGLTERSVQAIVADLEEAGYLIRTRVGRRTQYTVNPESRFRHPAQDGHRVGPLLDLLAAYDGRGIGDQRPSSDRSHN